MTSVLYFLFEPKSNILKWPAILDALSIFLLIIIVALVLFYYLVVPYKTTKNFLNFWITGILGSILFSILIALTLHFSKPIKDFTITFGQAFVVAAHAMVYIFIGYYLFSLIRKVACKIRQLKNGFLHKKTIPF